MRNKLIAGYAGGKNGNGVYHQIINQIRPHDVYIELFGGSLAIAQYKKPAPVKTIVNDLDPQTVSRWNPSTIDIPNCEVLQMCAIEFFATFEFSPSLKYVVYLDPPYPISSMRSADFIYRFEMTDQHHFDLLAAAKQLPTNVDVIISTYENEIYSEMLSGWRRHSFTAQTRRGPAIELIYMNYINCEGLLHQYDLLGTDYIDRQRIKRKIDREIEKLISLPAPERQAIISAVLDLSQLEVSM